MKILITGDRGFVGSETKKLLIEVGHEVIGYDLMDGYDIRDAEQFEKRVEETRPDRILHLAAIARFSDSDANPKLAYETNVGGTKNIAWVAFKKHIPVVYASSGSVYMPITEEPPITEKFQARGNSVYGCTKYAGELYIMECNPYIVLRYAHLYGSEKRMHGLVGGFVERINRGLAPTLNGGKQSNDFTYIKDVAKANQLALESPWDKWNQIYNIGTAQEITTLDASRLICKVTGYTGPVNTQEQRTVDPERFVFDITKAKVFLGFEPEYTFEEGLEHMFGKKNNES